MSRPGRHRRPFVQLRRMCRECGAAVPVAGLPLCSSCLAEFDRDALLYSDEPDLKAGAAEVLFDDLTADYQGDDWPMMPGVDAPEPISDGRSEVYDRLDES